MNLDIDAILERLKRRGSMKKTIKLSLFYSQAVFFILLPVWILINQLSTSDCHGSYLVFAYFPCFILCMLG